MLEKELQFDRKKHVCYSKVIKKLILEYLGKRYDQGEVENIWESVQLQYVEFLKDLPYLGGKGNRHNGAGGTYDCIMMFALYEVLEVKPTIEELFEMNNKAFMPPFERLGRLVNINKKKLQPLMSKIFDVTSKADKKLEGKSPNCYIMNVNPYDKEVGIRYKFLRCPIAEFAKAHNYLKIMPAFCNGDYPSLKLLHAQLIRSETCANGNCCDFWIVGDESEIAKLHPEKVDESGFIYNEIEQKW